MELRQFLLGTLSLLLIHKHPHLVATPLCDGVDRSLLDNGLAEFLSMILSHRVQSALVNVAAYAGYSFGRSGRYLSGFSTSVLSCLCLIILALQD